MQEDLSHHPPESAPQPHSGVAIPFLEHAPKPMFWLRPDGRFAYVNESACVSSGYSKDEFLRKHAFDLTPNLAKDRWEADWERAKLRNRFSIDLEFIPKNGPLISVEVNLCFLAADGCEFLAGIARDVTQRRHAVAELRRKEEETKEFAHRLTLLHEVSTELSAASRVDDICRQAVLLGRQRLGFDRLGIWLLEPGTEVAAGTFGTDEQGQLRDEHHLRDLGWSRELTDPVRQREVLFVHRSHVEVDFFGKPLGRADTSAAPLWDGKHIIGFLSCDNLLSKKPISDNDNQLLRIYAETLGFLITRKRADVALRHSEECYRLLVENIPFCVTFGDTSHTVQKINSKQARLFNVEPEDAIGKKCYEIFGTNAGEPCENCSAARAMASGEVIEQEECMPGRDGTEISLQVRTFPIRGVEDKVIGFLDVSEDITARKLEEKEHRLLGAAMQQSAEGILIMDLEWKIQFANPALEKLTGYSNAELLGQTHHLLSSPDPSLFGAASIERHLKKGEAWSGRIRIKRKDAKVRECEAAFSPVRGAQGGIANYVCALRDVTEWIELEQQLRQAQRMEAVGELAGGVAHDFNNLLQAIVGYTQMAMQALPPSARAYADLSEASKASERAAQLVRQLLTFSRRKAIQPTRMDLGEVVGDLAKMLVRVIGEHITLEMNVEPNLKPVYADQSQMEQILMNLCVNARSAMPDGGQLTIGLNNTVLDSQFLALHPWARAGEFVCMSVEDTGQGMSPEVRDRIFEPFFTTKAVGEGTGLGLSIVYGIVKQHEGMIHVYSEPSQGTIFRIYIPADKDRKMGLEENKEEGAAPGGQETLLLAEDDELVRALATRILQTAGYRILAARDGEEALRLFQENRSLISMAVLDVIMPKLSGRAVFDTIKRECPATPILFCSGYSGRGLSRSSLPSDGFELISKPFRPDALLRKVRAMLDQASLKQER